MTNQTKILIGVGTILAAVAAYFVFYKPAAGTKVVTTDGTVLGTVTNTSKCPDGQVPCQNKSGKCYDPSLNYYVDPCGDSPTKYPPVVNTNPPVQTGLSQV